MTCQPTAFGDPQLRIESFTAQYVLNGAYNASIMLADIACEDDPGCLDICKPVQLSIDSTLEGAGCGGENISSEVLSCFDESPIWVNGLMRSYGRSNSDATTSISVSSYFEYLNAKPINTQQFYGSNLSFVLDTIFRYYTGTPSALTCVNSFQDIRIKGPVEGNSTMSELAQLAQAGCANLFVQVGGCLTIERWKDHLSPTEFVIPPDLTFSAEPAQYKRSNTTVIRSRGASISKKDCGTTPISNNSAGPGQVTKCVIIGVPSPNASITHNNLTGSKEDILAGVEQSAEVSRIGNKRNVKDGSYSGLYVKKDGSTFGPDPSEINFLITANSQSDIDEGVFGQYFGPGQGGADGGFFNSLPQWLAGNFPVPFSIFGLGAFGSLPFINGSQSYNNQSDYQADQPSFQQEETVVSSPNIDECGIKYEEIENKYVPNKEHLFKLALRRFQEIQLSENTWNVEVPYIPCLKLNQVVEFTVPSTEDCLVDVVKGIIGGININHVKDEAGIQTTTMSLTVMDVSCLGQTPYTSGNLVLSSCAGESPSDLSPWQTAALGLESTSSVNGGRMFMATINTGVAFLNYTHSEMTAGDTYNWYFEYETISGSAVATYSAPIEYGSIGGNFSGDGFRSGSFAMPDGSTTKEWTFTLNGNGINTYMIIKNFKITKTVLS